MQLPGVLSSETAWTAISSVMAVLALGLSLRVYIREIFERRRATITARLEIYDKSEAEYQRLVVVNRGPASARAITMKTMTKDGKEYSALILFPDEEHSPTLHKDEEYHAQLIATDTTVALVTLSWHDGRWRTQHTKIWLSPQHLIG